MSYGGECREFRPSVAPIPDEPTECAYPACCGDPDEDEFCGGCSRAKFNERIIVTTDEPKTRRNGWCECGHVRDAHTNGGTGSCINDVGGAHQCYRFRDDSPTPIPDEGAREAWEPFERVHEAHLKMLAEWGEIADESEQEAHHIITSAHNLIAQLTTELAEARRERDEAREALRNCGDYQRGFERVLALHTGNIITETGEAFESCNECYQPMPCPTLCAIGVERGEIDSRRNPHQ